MHYVSDLYILWVLDMSVANWLDIPVAALTIFGWDWLDIRNFSKAFSNQSPNFTKSYVFRADCTNFSSQRMNQDDYGFYWSHLILLQRKVLRTTLVFSHVVADRFDKSPINS